MNNFKTPPMKHLYIKHFYKFIFIAILFVSNNSFAAGALDFESMLREYPEPIEAIDIDKLESAKGEALKAKDADKMYIFGVMYRDAINVDRDYLQAREWFQKSANNGSVEALVSLAKIQILNQDITDFETSFDSAVKNLTKAEEKGSKRAFYPIAELHEAGSGLTQDSVKALEYFTKAATEANDVNGYIKIAHYNYYGIGTVSDKRKAIEALMEVEKKSSDKTVVKNATRYLGLVFFQMALEQKNDERRFKLFELSWEYKNPLAADALGDLYQKGIGTRRDLKKAIEWYEKSISMESIYGMEKLGYIYITGPDDVDRDFKKAQDLFIKGSELGGVNAAYYLGYMYYNGLGIEKNATEADKWFKRSQLLAERSKKKQQNDEAIYQTFGAGYRDPLKETVDNNEKPVTIAEPNSNPNSIDSSSINGLAPTGLSANVEQVIPIVTNANGGGGSSQGNSDQNSNAQNTAGDGSSNLNVPDLTDKAQKVFENLQQDPSVPALPGFKN
jgi:TPR repeat protein